MMMKNSVSPYFASRLGKNCAPIMAALVGAMLTSSNAMAEDLACGTPETGQERLSLRLPENVRPMTAVELHELYRDKSWKWCDGAAYMQDKGRVFKGWSGSGDRASWADGHWTVANSGKLCFEADWHVKSGPTGGTTCFLHMTDGQTIYQRKEPTGGWYVFKHSEAQDNDEISKLVPEDLASEKIKGIRNQ
ncbi:MULTISPECIES: DUF995 domain-containing protein [Rhizobium]|uniref:DUF995 domain-containing protein n=1 Tax=Rhizobium favelukesii TaxID=348824 RepID=W6RLN4_9HYPH|nr:MULTISPECIES: DUF995 domain-containing protein [Rhizobium]MCA0804617.1 DUF995 domain-containing protein [Rhizobium sp. T1473]MCS0462096.1 DUF995 domain-containing protein [Rhizobium favelukesii]UFS79999.1 DUF995 domain-containing protein [Rhizobium sp. T136]CDM61729.1 hypothetical protein LPU83_pLPU83d_0358 [Rhizobium favelukesii]